MAEPFAPYAGIEGAGLTGGEGGDLLQKLLLGVLQGTAQIPQHVIDAAAKTAPPGLRREDYTDAPAPGGMVQAWQPGDQQRAATMDAATNLAGVGTSFAVPGAIGIFGGRLGATADKVKLAKAEEMAAAGADRHDIWNSTGWFKGADDKWRFEIPDNAAGLNPKTLATMPEVPEVSKIAGALHHPQLYKAYPDLRAADMRVGRGPEGGSYSDRFGELLNVTSPTSDKGRGVALHEVQHAIQAREGFARGGSPYSFAMDKAAAESNIDNVNDAMRGLVRDMDLYKATGNKEKAAEAKAEYDRLMEHKLKNLVPTAQIDPYEGYRSLAGEVEARNVEKRKDMNLLQLHQNPPWMTEDIAPEKQIVRMMGGGKVGALNAPAENFGAALESKYPGVKLDIGAPSAGGYATLGRIVVPEAERGAGVGSKVMADLIAEADAKGIPLALSPTSDFGGSKARLAGFYERFGFVPNKGKNKDFATRETMIRLPRKGGE